jgi:hypothetical protein
VKEKKMANKRFSLGMTAILLASCFMLFCCTTNVPTLKQPGLDKKPIPTTTHDYTILGTVRLEKKWFGIMGFSIEKVGIDAYLLKNGGVTYVEIQKKERKTYSDADAVIDVQVDYVSSAYAIFYAQRKNILSGLAIKYVKEPKPNIFLNNFQE